MENRIDVILTPENKDAIFQAVSSVKLAMPFLIKLSDNERKSLQ